MKKLLNEILVAVRDNFSQNYINEKLGYSYNKVSKWERGQDAITLEQFVLLCEACNKKDKLNLALVRVLGIRENLSHSKILFRYLIKELSDFEVTKIINISEATLKRWKNNKYPPSFLAILKLIDYHKSLPQFLSYIVNIDKVPMIKGEVERLKTKKGYFFENPLAEVMVYILEMEEYKKQNKHDDNYVAMLLNISIDDEQKYLKQLLNIGMIRKQKNKYIPIYMDEFNTSFYSDTYDLKFNNLLKEFWLKRALEILGNLQNDAVKNIFMNQTQLISIEADRQIKKELNDCFHKIALICKEDRGNKELIRAVNFQYITCIKSSL